MDQLTFVWPVAPFSVIDAWQIFAQFRGGLLSDQGLISRLHVSKSQFRRSVLRAAGSVPNTVGIPVDLPFEPDEAVALLRPHYDEWLRKSHK